jgi:hypothetical protein
MRDICNARFRKEQKSAITAIRVALSKNAEYFIMEYLEWKK